MVSHLILGSCARIRQIIDFEAIQCNVSGTSDFISCRAAPLPNDIQWSNMDIYQRIISNGKRNIYAQLISLNGLVIRLLLFLYSDFYIHLFFGYYLDNHLHAT